MNDPQVLVQSIPWAFLVFSLALGCVLGFLLGRESLRRRMEQDARERESAQQELARLKTQADERERRVEELKQTLEDSKSKLVEAFKATGADVLRQNAQVFMETAREQLVAQSKLSSQELEARQKAIDLSIKPLAEQLQKQERLVLELNLKREGDSKTLSAQVQSLIELQNQARDAALALSSAMRDHRQRGRWGEVALRNVAELAGLTAGIDFFEQEHVSAEDSSLRPDMVVRLPNQRVIPVDSKVPLSAYLDSMDPARTDAEREVLRASHAQALRTHVRALARKDYARNLDGEIEFTILFVPVESAFTAAFEADPALFPDALEKKVIVATPSTLLALLRTVALHWKSAHLAENAEKIGREAGEFLSRMSTFIGHFSALGEKLDASVKAYNKALGSVESRLQPSVTRIAALLSADSPDLPEALVESPRGIKERVDPRAE
jgi:DNA recombination protein RmuC